MSVAGGDDNWWQSTMNNANSVQIVREDLCPWQVAMTINWQYFNSGKIVTENLCPWRVVTTINDNQQWIMPTLSKSSEKIYVRGRWLWQSTGNNFNCGKIVGENLCPWQAVTTIDDNQQWIMPTLSKLSEKIYVCGPWLWQSLTINWQYFNSGKIVRQDLCPWQVVTTIDDNQLWIMPTLSKSSEKIYVCGRRWWQLMTINWQ